MLLKRWKSPVSLSLVQTDDPPTGENAGGEKERAERSPDRGRRAARWQGLHSPFGHFRPRVQAQLVRLGLAPTAAEDLTQDVMETIWRKAHLYDPRQSAAITWVFQIARNRRIDMKRRTREFNFAAEDFFAIPDPAQGCDDCLDAVQREECVRVALNGLPHELFTLVRLAFFEGLSHSAIARQLNLPLGTVKSRLRLACARLRRSLLDASVTEARVAG